MKRKETENRRKKFADKNKSLGALRGEMCESERMERMAPESTATTIWRQKNPAADSPDSCYGKDIVRQLTCDVEHIPPLLLLLEAG